jgi:hypothetical protein
MFQEMTNTASATSEKKQAVLEAENKQKTEIEQQKMAFYKEIHSDLPDSSPPEKECLMRGRGSLSSGGSAFACRIHDSFIHVGR